MRKRNAKNKHSTKKASAKKLLRNPFLYVTIIGIAILSTIVIILAIIIGQNQHEQRIRELNNAYIFLGRGHNSSNETSAMPDRIITSYANYQNAIQYITFANPNTPRLTKSDFNSNNYAIIVVRYDSCSKASPEPSEFTADTNQIHIVFDYDSTCGNCAAEYYFYAFKLDKSITNANIVVDYHTRSSETCDESLSKTSIPTQIN